MKRSFKDEQRRLIFDFLRLAQDSEVLSLYSDEEHAMALWEAASSLGE